MTEIAAGGGPEASAAIVSLVISGMFPGRSLRWLGDRCHEQFLPLFKTIGDAWHPGPGHFFEIGWGHALSDRRFQSVEIDLMHR